MGCSKHFIHQGGFHGNCEGKNGSEKTGSQKSGSEKASFKNNSRKKK